MKKNWSAKQKLATVISVGIVSAALLILFVIKPQVGELSRLHLLTQTRRNEYTALLLEEQSYRTARTDFAKIEDNASIIQNLFPVREKLVGHIQRLEAAAEAFGDEFSLSITDSEEASAQTQLKAVVPPYTIVPNLKQVEIIPYDFTVQGSFIGVIHFLQTLENQPFFSEIETLDLNSKFLSGLAPTGSEVRSGQTEGHMRAAFYAKK